MGLNTEVEVTQDLRTQPVTQTDILEPDHVPLRRAAANARPAHQPPSQPLYSNAHCVGVDQTFSQCDRLVSAPFAAQRSARPFGFPLVSGPLTNRLLACPRILSGAIAD